MISIHKQVLIQLGDKKAEVDSGIAELILAMWQLGIDTIMSCENNRNSYDIGDVVWILMPSSDVDKFINVLAPNCVEDDFTKRVSGDYNRIVDLDKNWKYSGVIFGKRSRSLKMHTSIRFPIYDYDETLNRLKENLTKVPHNAGEIMELV